MRRRTEIRQLLHSMRQASRKLVLAVAVLGFVSPAATAAADFARVAESLRRLPVETRILYITAHPDDETPGVLTYLARGLGARVALLSVTRGEGGQNVVGHEQEEALGVLRTGELLAASRRYGCELYFTRAFDFGFTKSADETLSRWGEQEIVGDIVARIRQFRPHIVIARWAGTTADRHGQHQAVGILIRKAYAAAADTEQFPAERFGQPWSPESLYLQARPASIGAREPAEGVVRLPVDDFSLLLGGTFHEFGVVGFAEHRTQGMASAALRYPRWTLGLRLLESSLPPERQPREARQLVENLSALARRYPDVNQAMPELSGELARVVETLDTAAARLNPTQPSAVVPVLVAVARQLRSLNERVMRLQASDAAELRDELESKEEAVRALIAKLLGLRVQAMTETADWVAGESYRVRVRVENGSSAQATVVDVELVAPPGWKAERVASSGQAPAGEAEFLVTVPADAPTTQAYWRRLQPSDGRYVDDQPEFAGLPFPPPLVSMRVHWQLAAGEIEGTLLTPVERRGGDPVRGPERRQVLVVPAVTVEALPLRRLISTSSEARAVDFALRLRYFGSQDAEVAVALRPPSALGPEPPVETVHVSRAGQQALSRFHLTLLPQPRPSSNRIGVTAQLGGKTYDLWRQEIAHPEVTMRYWYVPAQAEVTVLDLRVPSGLRVGYVAGENDPVPEALGQAGIEVTNLDELHLALDDLSRFDAIVVGIQAYELRADLARLNQRLLDYVARGGTLLVQYQLQCNRGPGRSCVWNRTWNELNPAPFPAEMGPQGDERITQEASPVRLLEPRHRLLTFPNKITEEDFQGWIDERGLYFWKQWDAHYVPLLALRDPGEPELLGGLLVASYGKGLYIYTGISFFRQLPAGVPGAFRLFVNLLSAGKKDAEPQPSPPRRGRRARAKAGRKS